MSEVNKLKLSAGIEHFHTGRIEIWMKVHTLTFEKFFNFTRRDKEYFQLSGDDEKNFK